MRTVELVFAVGWGAFWSYWLLAAFSMRRGQVPWSRELGIRVLIVIIVVILTRLGAFRGHHLNTDPGRGPRAHCSRPDWDYGDGRISCDERGVRIARYYPWGAKRTPFETIRQVSDLQLTGGSVRWRIWGSGDFVHW